MHIKRFLLCLAAGFLCFSSTEITSRASIKDNLIDGINTVIDDVIPDSDENDSTIAREKYDGTTPSVIELPDGSTLTAPYAYGELEDGVFARPNYSDELSWLQENFANDYPALYSEELIKVSDTRALDSLTPEMEAAGYVLQNGIVYLPGEETSDASSEGDAVKISGSMPEDVEYDEDGNPVVDYNCGYVTFTCNVNPDIHQTIYAQFLNEDTDKEYYIELFEENSYSKHVQLQEGHYQVTAGGLVNDYKSEYPIELASFDVTAGAPVTVILNIGVTAEEVKNGTTIVIIDSLDDVNPAALSVTSVEEKASGGSPLPAIGLSIVIISAILLIVLIIYRKGITKLH